MVALVSQGDNKVGFGKNAVLNLSRAENLSFYGLLRISAKQGPTI